MQTLRLEPGDADAWIILGNLHKQANGNLAMADACYRRALVVNPNDPILLTNYGALMGDLGNLEQAEEFFERAIAANPSYPNPYYALALIEQRRNQPAAACQTLERLFAGGKPADGRAQPLYVEARKLYAAVNERSARQDSERLMQYVFGRKDELEAETGYPIEIVEDPRLSPEYATLQPAWKYRRDHHLLRYRVKSPTITPHLLPHELRHLMLEAAARRAGRNRVYVMTARNRELAYRSIEGEIGKLRKQGLPADVVDRVVSEIITGLANQLLNIPFDMAIESDLFTHEAPIRASQFVSLRFTHEDQLQAFTRQDIRRMAPPRVWRANIAMNHAYALFVDSLYGGATDYAAVYRASEVAATAQKLFGLWADLKNRRQPGDEYALVDAFAEVLQLGDWYTWQPDLAEGPPAPAGAGDGVQALLDYDAEDVDITMTPSGSTNQALLKQKEPAVTMYLLGALQRFAGMERADVERVGVEIGLLGMEGLDYASPEQRYTLRALPGESFSGLHLMALMYVAFKQLDPTVDTGMNFDEAYQVARRLYEAGQG